MSWLFKHKLLLGLIVAGIWYWHINPSGRFGIVRPGFVIFNKIPIFLFDCYISSERKLFLEDDLSKAVNIDYWLDNHFSMKAHPSPGEMHLIVGTGFTDDKEIVFDKEHIARLRKRNIVYEALPSKEAIIKYNSLVESGNVTHMLLKIQ